MQHDGIRVSAFTTHEPQQRLRYGRRTPHRRKQPEVRAGSMLLKIGFCMAVLAAAIFVQKYLLTDATAPISVEADADATPSAEEDDVLGRLQFVEAKGVRSVFATSQRWRSPIAETAAKAEDDGLLLRLTGRTGETVSAPAAGEVRAIGFDDALGAYVRLHHGSDLESVYYNISDVCVEKGQPLRAQDTLGTLGADGVLYVKVSVNGVPQKPAAYLDVAE